MAIFINSSVCEPSTMYSFGRVQIFAKRSPLARVLRNAGIMPRRYARQAADILSQKTIAAPAREYPSGFWLRSPLDCAVTRESVELNVDVHSESKKASVHLVFSFFFFLFSFFFFRRCLRENENDISTKFILVYRRNNF